jgi:AraC-like DNA-binding protein
MKTKNRAVLPLNWRTELGNLDAYSIDQDLILLDKPIITSTFEYPFKVDVAVAIISIKGKTEGSINLKPYVTDGACLITILPGQVMQYKSISEDFEGLFIVMSSKFTESLMPNASDRLPLQLSVRDNPAIPLDDETLKGMINYFDMLKKVIQVDDHPFRLEVARHLTLAFFYGVGAVLNKIPDNPKLTHHETLVDRYLTLVQKHFKEQRGLEFYADKLCVTAKHLSKVVKATSGKPSNDWIDEHVALEAKALIKSTNMTVEQISEELNFPSQSFFGKYFKRVTGLSPRDYKIKG